MHRSRIDGLICVGGAGILNGLQLLSERIVDGFFKIRRRSESTSAAILTRKVGHTQRGGKAVDVLLDGQNNAIAALQWNCGEGFYVDSIDANVLIDQWGHIRARHVHPTFYDDERVAPSRMGTEYLLQIFSQAPGHDDVENIRRTSFDSGNLFRPYHSVNADVARRIRYLSG